MTDLKENLLKKPQWPSAGCGCGQRERLGSHWGKNLAPHLLELSSVYGVSCGYTLGEIGSIWGPSTAPDAMDGGGGHRDTWGPVLGCSVLQSTSTGCSPEAWQDYTKVILDPWCWWGKAGRWQQKQRPGRRGPWRD